MPVPFFFFSLVPFFLTMTQFLFFSFFFICVPPWREARGQRWRGPLFSEFFFFLLPARTGGAHSQTCSLRDNTPGRERGRARRSTLGRGPPVGRTVRLPAKGAGQHGKTALLPRTADARTCPPSTRPGPRVCDGTGKKTNSHSRKENQVIDDDRHRRSARSHADNNVGIYGDGATGAACPRIAACRARL